MVISIQQGNLNVGIDLGEDSFDKSVSCEDVLLAAFDIISRVFSQEGVVRAYYRLNADTMSQLSEDDFVRKMCPEYKRE